MSFKSYREDSRTNYGTTSDGLTLEQIQIGCMQRIADATEVMAKRYNELIRQRDQYERWYQEECERSNRLERSCRGLRSVITRLKNKENPYKKEDLVNT